MSIYYLSFGCYWRNLTSPLTYWHRGTAFQSDHMKDHLEIQVPHMDLGTDVVLLTMAARIMQAMISLVKNRLPRRAWYWKRFSGGWISKAVHVVLWTCWQAIDLLLAMEMTGVYVNRTLSQHKLQCDTPHTMNAISIKYHWEYPAEPVREVVPEEEELPSNTQTMEKFQDDTYMDVDSGCKLFSNLDSMVSRELLLQSCTNPEILSMICIPSEDEESLLPSGESDIDEVEKDMSVDSGVQEPSAEESKDGQDSDEESDWSQEDEDSWDEDSDADCNKEDEDLWASFFRSDDPYNPLSFAMPTSSKQQDVKLKKEVPVVGPEKQKGRDSPDCAKSCAAFKVACGPAGENQKRTARRPVLSNFKSSHKCFLKNDELECSQDTKEQGKESIKRVRFSSAVTVHPIVVWDYAHRMARKGPWEEYARDRCRFQRRIADTQAAIGYCLEAGHRERIWARLQSQTH